MFGKYFFKILDLNVNDNMENIKHEESIKNKNNPFGMIYYCFIMIINFIVILIYF